MLAHPQWVGARDRVLSALDGHRQWTALLGPPGTGKTMLLYDIAQTIADSASKAIRNAAELGKPPVLVVSAGPYGVALFDDADQLTDEAMASFAADDGPQCVFAGSPELADRLRRHVPGTEIVTLGLLSPADARDYLTTWLAGESLSPQLLDSEAESELIAASAGVPRVLSDLVWRAAQTASGDRSTRIRAGHVGKARSLAAGMSAADPSPPKGGWYWNRQASVSRPKFAAAGGLAMAVCVGVAVVHADFSSRVAAMPAAPVITARNFGPPAATLASLALAVPSPQPPASFAPFASAPPADTGPPAALVLAAQDAPPPTPPAETPLPPAPRPPAPLAAISAPSFGTTIANPTQVPDMTVVLGRSTPGQAQPVTSGAAMAPANDVAANDLAANVVAANVVAFNVEAVATTAAVASGSAMPPPITASLSNPVAAERPNSQVAVPVAKPAAAMAPIPKTMLLAAVIPAPELGKIEVATVEPKRPSAPGLLLTVRSGETLAGLYVKVYQGVVPPPLEEVAAANPKRVKAGDVLTFPAPPGGWQKQRTAGRSIS